MAGSRALRALYPALVAAYPALLIASGNVPEYSVVELVCVCALALAAGAAVHAVAALAWRRRADAEAIALAAAGVNAWLFCALLLENRVLGITSRWVMPTLLAGAALTFALPGRLSRARGAVRGASRFVGIFALALVGMTVATIASGRRRVARDYESSAVVRELREPLPPARDGSPRPDVYLVILDNLANGRVLEEVYGADRGAFGDSLRALGFTLPPVTWSNYPFTAPSVASLLNAGHVRGLETDLGARSTDRGVLFRLAQDNRVSRWFREAGYAVYVQPSIGFAGTGQNLHASGTFLPPGLDAARLALARSDLLMALLQQSVPGRALGRLGLDQRGGGVRLIPLRTVASTAELPSPKFVIAHSLAAHDPYVFDASCTFVGPGPDGGLAAREAYVRTVGCTERLVLAAVREILARSASRPIIVVQADHGTRALGAPVDGPPERITGEQARERMGAFGAYLVPPGTMPDTVTPVNVFRYVLRALGAPVERVADASYYSTYAAPYHFVDVTPFLATPDDPAAGTSAATH